MFEPEELMARIVDLEAQLEVSEMAPPAAEQLIACLEGEIAKRDARIVELESRYQRDVYGLNNEGDPIGGDPAGGYANDNARLRAELSAIKAQEPVDIEFRQFMTDVVTGAGLMSCGRQSKGLAAELSANAYKYLLGAPVSEAKAQGVVQWPGADEIMQMAFEEGQPADDASGYCFELEEFDLFIERLMSEVARLNAAPVSEAKAQVVMPERAIKDGGKFSTELKVTGWNACLDEVARLNATPVKQVSVPVWWRELLRDIEQFFEGAGVSPGPDIELRMAAMLAAAPSAPAADAGLVAVEWEKDAEEWGPALNGAGWLFLSELNEDPQKSALIFNNTKGPLRAAIMKYAEIVAANAKDSSHD